MRRRRRAQRRDQDEGDERRERGGGRDGAKAAPLVKRSSKRRANGEGRKHCRPHPRDDLPGVVRADAGEPPRRRPDNDEAFGPAEDGAAGEQDRD